MKAVTYTQTSKAKNHTILLFASAVFITLMLFFIDEGFYHFEWMHSIGNWIIFSIYLAVIFLGS